jgi:hypothetical protein
MLRLDVNTIDYAIIAVYFLVVARHRLRRPALHQDEPRLLPSPDGRCRRG